MKLGTPRKLKFSDHEPVIDTINFDDRHRLTGMTREYADNNVKRMLSSTDTKERLKYHQMYGYRGHTFFKHGFFSDEVDPVCVCTKIEYEWPYLQHTERFLDTENAMIAESLYDSGTHGFSWATGGKDGGEYHPTRVDFIQGFDLVGTESFISEEKKVLFDSIGESLTAKGFTREEADKIGESLLLEADHSSPSQSLFDAQSKINQLRFELESAQQMIADQDRIADMIGESFKQNCPFEVPNEILQLIVSPKTREDTDKIAEFFRRTSNIDTTQLPSRRNLNAGRSYISRKTEDMEALPSVIDAVFLAMPTTLS